MKYIADLHVHSRFSRATAKNLDFENLYIEAQLKGINIVATGDFTHPGWFLEIKEKLVPAEEGLFKLKEDLEKKCDLKVPDSCRGIVRFILETEISNIYKKKGKVRKNHNLIFLPDLDTVLHFNSVMEKIGNIKSDGRPILGLDTKKLLEILLNVSDKGFLVPAHIWTPWFSLFGSKSGFDSLEECFEDLTSYIFAVETGLSSDPAMNWLVSSLDKITLISNSDAHSPSKLGREANIFNTDFSYNALKNALKTGDSSQFLGTYEFYPEEGKYHLDGHRKCNIRFFPEETKKHEGICPVCGKPLTIGVMYRVEELSDRGKDDYPEKRHPFYNIIPLSNILSEILKTGIGSKKFQNNYDIILSKLGTEFEILNHLSIEDIKRAGVPLLAEAIDKMRRKQIVILPGFDGEFGTIKVFDDQERKKLLSQKLLFSMPSNKADLIQNINQKKDKEIIKILVSSEKSIYETQNLCSLNEEQKEAVTYKGGPLLIVAGPGTGKTRTLTHRIAYLIKEKEMHPSDVVAVTFTNKAAQEMRERLLILMEDEKLIPFVGTFHSLCLNILKEETNNQEFSIIDESDRKILISDVIKIAKFKNVKVNLSSSVLLDKIVAAKQQIILPVDFNEKDLDNNEENVFNFIYKTYQNLLSIQNLYDYEDLILNAVLLLQNNKEICLKYKERFKYIFIDEYQDINYGQYLLIKCLSYDSRKICAIGDPNQSIYGFRGSDVKFFNNFKNDYPGTKIIKLIQNYRSTKTILNASSQIIKNQDIDLIQQRIYSNIDGTKSIGIIETASEESEGFEIAKLIGQMIGGTGYHNIDNSRIIDPNISGDMSFSDFAVLYRTGDQGRLISDIFSKAGIPFQLISKENIFDKKGFSEIISIIKIIEGYGIYSDFKKLLKMLVPDINSSILDKIIINCYETKYSMRYLTENTVNDNFFDKELSKNNCNKIIEFLNSVKVIKTMNIEDKISYLLKNSCFNNITSNMENITSLFSNSDKFINNINGFLTHLAFQTDTDIYSKNAEKVALMTMHASKGLEFPVVFIAGCENNIIPFKRLKDTYSDIDEERRLFYVAMTRAKERLYLTYSKKRKIYGKLFDQQISPFLNEIENDLKTSVKQFIKKKKESKQSQLSLFN